jgi:hypothetical protein
MEGVDIFLEQMNEATLIRPLSLEKIGKDLDFPMGLRLILNNIKREWAGSKKIQPLLDYVYSTAPMTEVKKDNPDPEAKVRLDLKKEREKLLCELGV